eukprot:scaffold13891_cov125-Isochrysis_galbana.AAC.3
MARVPSNTLEVNLPGSPRMSFPAGISRRCLQGRAPELRCVSFHGGGPAGLVHALLPNRPFGRRRPLGGLQGHEGVAGHRKEHHQDACSSCLAPRCWSSTCSSYA